MAKKVADQLIDTIAEAGIKRIYAVTGDSLNAVNDAVSRNGKVEWVQVRHEETGAFAAAAEAQLNGIACCAGSSGPGHVHLINGLYEAQRNNASVLAIASTCATDEFGIGFFQETDPKKLFADCSGYNQMAMTSKQFPRMLQAALQHAYSKKEVAVLGLPGDVSEQDAVESATTTYLLRNKAVYRPGDEDLQKLADKLNGVSKVTIYCGYGAGEAHDEVVKLAELLKSPVAYSFRGKMGIQYDNPNEVGMTGLLGLPSAYHAMHHSDVLLLLGTDFPYKAFMPDNIEILQIDSRPERIGRKAKVSMGLAGDIKDTLSALLPRIKNKKSASFLKSEVKRYEDVKKALNIYVEDRGKKGNISPEFVASTLNDLAADDAIFTVDTGMCCVWGARYIKATGKRVLLGSFSHGSMANALPHAIGASFARPDQQVIALCGDGGLSMMLGDLATVVQYKLPVKVIVFDNRSLGMVRLEMQVAGLPDRQTDMYNPDFVKIAEAMGMPSYYVEDPDEVQPTLEAALASGGPVLVHIKTNPNSLAMPPVIDFNQIKGYALSMSKLIFDGKVDEVIEILKSNYKRIHEIL